MQVKFEHILKIIEEIFPSAGNIEIQKRNLSHVNKLLQENIVKKSKEEIKQNVKNYRILFLIEEIFPCLKKIDNRDTRDSIWTNVYLKLSQQPGDRSDEELKEIIKEEKNNFYKKIPDIYTKRKTALEESSLPFDNGEDFDEEFQGDEDFNNDDNIDINNQFLVSAARKNVLTENEITQENVKAPIFFETSNIEKVIKYIEESKTLTLLYKESLIKHFDNPYPAILLENFTPLGKSRIFSEAYIKLLSCIK